MAGTGGRPGRLGEQICFTFIVIWLEVLAQPACCVATEERDANEALAAIISLRRALRSLSLAAADGEASIFAPGRSRPFGVTLVN